MTNESTMHWQRPSELRVSNIVESTFSIFFARFASFYIVGLLMTSPMLWFFYDILENENDISLHNFGGMIGSMFLLGAICQPVLMYATFQQIRRQRVSLLQ